MASATMGRIATTRCLPPLPVTTNCLSKGTSAPVSDKASAILNPAPYSSSSTALSRAPTHSTDARSATPSANPKASSGVTGRGRPFFMRGPLIRGGCAALSPIFWRANVMKALSADSSRAAELLLSPSLRREAICLRSAEVPMAATALQSLKPCASSNFLAAKP